MAFGGEHVVAIARPGAFGLLEKVQRERSAEFHPGLANSALSDDVQRVIDVVNLLDSAPAPIPPLHRVDVDVRLPDIRKPQIAERMEAARTRHEQEMDATRKSKAEPWGTRPGSTTEMASDAPPSKPQSAGLPNTD